MMQLVHQIPRRRKVYRLTFITPAHHPHPLMLLHPRQFHPLTVASRHHSLMDFHPYNHPLTMTLPSHSPTVAPHPCHSHPPTVAPHPCHSHPPTVAPHPCHSHPPTVAPHPCHSHPLIVAQCTMHLHCEAAPLILQSNTCCTL